MVAHTLAATHKRISTDTRASGSLLFSAARLATEIRPFERVWAHIGGILHSGLTEPAQPNIGTSLPRIMQSCI